MDKMKNNILPTVLLLFCLCPLKGFSSEDSLQTELRVRPEDRVFRLICRATNITDDSVIVDRKLLRGSNLFKFHFLNDMNRVWGVWGPPGGELSEEKALPSGAVNQWVTNDLDFKSLYEFSMYDINSDEQNLDDKRGSYINIRWHLNLLESSQIILLGFTGKDGNLRKPVVKDGSNVVEILVGFVYHEDNPLMLGFLVMNGSDETIAIEKPLNLDSRIIATSPTIGYTRELVVPNSTAEDAVVEAGEVGEWRLPWQTVLNLIPEEELDKIKAAGGDLDLVWKVGDYQSDPLPISLADPVGISIEE